MLMTSEEMPKEWTSSFKLNRYVVLAAILSRMDKNLDKVRCELVPDFVEEEAFWSVYFYRIYQFKHSMGLLPSIQQVASAIE